MQTTDLNALVDALIKLLTAIAAIYAGLRGNASAAAVATGVGFAAMAVNKTAGPGSGPGVLPKKQP